MKSPLFTLIFQCWRYFNFPIVTDNLSATLPDSSQVHFHTQTPMLTHFHTRIHTIHTHTHRPFWTCFTRFCFGFLLQHCLLYWVALVNFFNHHYRLSILIGTCIVIGIGYYNTTILYDTDIHQQNNSILNLSVKFLCTSLQYFLLILF